MSIADSLFGKKVQNKCNHKEQININKANNKSYFYCFNCNNIILIDNDKTYCTYKLSLIEDDINDNVEFDPVILIKLMIERQEEQIKDINEKFVINYSHNDSESNIDSDILVYDDSEKKGKEKNKNNFKNNKYINKNLQKEKVEERNKLTKLLFDEDIFDKYAKHRNKILIYIHKLCTKLKYNDSSFYLCLYLLDTYLSRIFSEDITERELFLIVLGFFLISSKYIEDDIFEPELQMFCNIEKSLLLTMDEIRASEVQCLTLINYNLYLYSTYDWLNIFISNGIIFENEVKDLDELGNVYLYTQKLLTQVTSKAYFFKYSSMQIALSIVQISRERFIHDNIQNSDKLFKLLISLYGVDFSYYEECYNVIKKDSDENNDSDDEIDESNNTNSNTNTTKSTTTNINSNINISDLNKNRSIPNILSEEMKKQNFNTTERKNKFKLTQNSNPREIRKYNNTDYNLKLKISKNSTNNKYKLYSSPGGTKFSAKKLKFKSNDKNYEILPNNSIDIFGEFNKKLSPNKITSNSSYHNTSIKSCNYMPKEEKKNLMINYFKNDKPLILTGKNQKNQNVYLNYANKLLIKNSGPNINNINYINNINISNEVFNLYSESKKKQMQKNVSSGLNFNFVYNINDNNNIKNDNNANNESNNDKYVLKTSLFTLGNSNNGEVNYEYNINNINNIKNNINIQKDSNYNTNNINIATSQNIISIKNATNGKFKTHKKMDPNKKEKYKTHLLLDIGNNQNGNIIYNRNGNNQIIIPQEKENKSCSKYTFNGYNDANLPNQKKKQTFKLHLGSKNQIKVMNTNININLNNQLSSRKFTINFKDIVNNKINLNRKNNFMTKDNNNNSNNNNNRIKRFKSMNSNKALLSKNNNNNNNKKSKNNYNDIKSIINKGNMLYDTNSTGMNNNHKIFTKNIMIDYKNLGMINSNLPRLKLNKKKF